MPSTIDFYPHLGENVTGIGTIAWSNPSNILAGDGVYSTVTTGAGTTSNYLGGRDYRFTLNPGSTIDGIVVKTRLSCSGTDSNLNFALTDDTGAIIGAPQNITIFGSVGDTNYTIGNISDLWSAVLTPTIVNNINFGVRMWHTGAHTINIDWATIRVYYTPGPVVMPVDTGNYPCNSIPDTNLVYELRVMPGLSGNYPFNALSTTNLERFYVGPASAGNYAYNTFQAGLVHDIRSVSADPKTFPFFGYDVSFNNPVHVLTANQYIYPFFGYAATFVVITPASSEIVMSALAGNYQVFGRIGGLAKLPIRIEYGTGAQPAITFHAPQAVDFTLIKTTLNTVIGGTTGAIITDRDNQTQVVTGAETRIEYQLGVPDAFVIGYRSANESIATVDGAGKVSAITPGLVNVIADTASCSKAVFCNVNILSGQVARNFVDYAPGSLAYKLCHDLDSMITGTNHDINGAGLLGWTPLRRNMDNWAVRAGVDMSPVGILNQIYASHCQLTMITPRHCITADHAKIPADTWGQWLANDGTDRVCQRNLVSWINPVYPSEPPGASTFMDLRVYKLDSDIDNYIGHIQFMPEKEIFMPRLPSIRVNGLGPITNPYTSSSVTFRLPMIVQDQKKISNIIEYSSLSNSVNIHNYNPATNAPETYPRSIYRFASAGPIGGSGSGGGISGDSGSPEALIYNGRLVCVLLLSSTCFVDTIGILQNAIDTLGNPDNYQIDVPDWTMWPIFSLG